jgi:hypothetical protein
MWTRAQIALTSQWKHILLVAAILTPVVAVLWPPTVAQAQEYQTCSSVTDGCCKCKYSPGLSCQRNQASGVHNCDANVNFCGSFSCNPL